MEAFPNEHTAKERLHQRGIDVEQSYQLLLLQLAGKKAVGLVEVRHEPPADRARRLRAEGMTPKQIVYVMKTPVSTVYTWLRR